MRLDKFLKVSRLIKRRTVANEACDNGRISVNGRVVKANLRCEDRKDCISGGFDSLEQSAAWYDIARDVYSTIRR